MANEENNRYLDRVGPTDDAPTIYSDSFRMHISPTTITIDFRRAEPWVRDPHDRTLVHVQLNPINAGYLAGALQQVIDRYNTEMERAADEHYDEAKTTTDRDDDESTSVDADQ